jgi:type II secretory pathway pseudopilin PulG
MRFTERFLEDKGYTLVESLVSLALVAAVLIPLGVTIGTFVISQEGSRVSRALQLAQSNLNQAIVERDFRPDQEVAEDVFLAHRTTQREGNLVTIRVSVALARRAEQPIVNIQKSVVVYP